MGIIHQLLSIAGWALIGLMVVAMIAGALYLAGVGGYILAQWAGDAIRDAIGDRRYRRILREFDEQYPGIRRR